MFPAWGWRSPTRPLSPHPRRVTVLRAGPSKRVVGWSGGAGGEGGCGELSKAVMVMSDTEGQAAGKGWGRVCRCPGARSGPRRAAVPGRGVRGASSVAATSPRPLDRAPSVRPVSTRPPSWGSVGKSSPS